MSDLSPARRRALEILRDAGWEGMLASQFAELMWPDSPKWQASYQCGNGASRGIAVNRSGGAFLGKLRKAGLTAEVWDGHRHWHSLSAEGKRMLADASTADLSPETGVSGPATDSR